MARAVRWQSAQDSSPFNLDAETPSFSRRERKSSERQRNVQGYGGMIRQGIQREQS